MEWSPWQSGQSVVLWVFCVFSGMIPRGVLEQVFAREQWIFFTYLAGYSDIERTEQGLWKSLFTGICEAPQEDNFSMDKRPAWMEMCHGPRLCLKQCKQNLPKQHWVMWDRTMRSCWRALSSQLAGFGLHCASDVTWLCSIYWSSASWQHLEQALGALPAPGLPDFCQVLQLEGEAFPPTASC